MTAPEGTGWFVYAMVPGDVEPVPDARGLRDGRIDVVRHGDVAALVSEVPLDEPVGSPDDLVTYASLLDGAAAAVPVLPVRFGTVLASRDGAEAMLAAGHDEYRAALSDMDGRVEYVVRVRYDEPAVLAEVLAEQPAAAELRERLRGVPEGAETGLRIRLGEMVSHAIEAKRVSDTQRLVESVAATVTATAASPPTHEYEAANVAFLVETARVPEFEEALDALASEWDGRATVRILGPLAPYHFVQLAGRQG